MNTQLSNRFSLLTVNLFLFLILFSTTSTGQSFVEINAGITGISNSSAMWGDFDNDKDLDIIISGETSGGSTITKIYNNDNSSFTDIGAGLTGMKNGVVAWGDYDNDGDLDIITTGDNSNQQTYIYKNDDGGFSDINATLDYFGAFSYACWGDYDNDGDLDIFITGSWSSKLYRNDGQDTFTDTENEFFILNSSRADWGDYDKDGDLDLLLTGDTGGGMELFLYKNNDGIFEEFILANMGLSSGSVEWGDYDSDGDLDILIMGFDNYIEPSASIFRNDGEHVFVNIYAGLPPVALGNASWGDFDNDGDLDVAITGKLAGCGVFASAVYENEGNDFFDDTNAGLLAAQQSTIAWGDFDNDTDLDIFLSGSSYTGGSFTKIYRNDFSLPNILPDEPQNLSVSFEENKVILSWDKGNDPQTPQDGLSYNIRIGTSPLGCDNLSPMSHINNGYRKIAAIGNTCQSDFWTITGLEEGVTYYWSVQTIDNTFAASEFSEEQSFFFSYTGTENLKNEIVNFSLYPNPAKDFIIFTFQDSGKENFSLNIYSLQGKKIKQQQINNNEKIDVSDFEKGVYFFNILGDDSHYTQRLVIE